MEKEEFPVGYTRTVCPCAQRTGSCRPGPNCCRRRSWQLSRVYWASFCPLRLTAGRLGRAALIVTRPAQHPGPCYSLRPGPHPAPAQCPASTGQQGHAGRAAVVACVLAALLPAAPDPPGRSRHCVHLSRELVLLLQPPVAGGRRRDGADLGTALCRPGCSGQAVCGFVASEDGRAGSCTGRPSTPQALVLPWCVPGTALVCARKGAVLPGQRGGT